MSKRTEKENQNWMQAYIVSFFASDTVALGNWSKMIQREQTFSLFSYVKKFSLEQVCDAMCKKLKINQGFFLTGTVNC